MASPPWLSTTESGESTWTTSHTVSLGAYQPADHLIICSGFDGSNSVVTDPTGWTVMWSEDLDFARRGRAYIRQMDGTEGSTLTIATATGAQSSHHVLRFEGGRTGVTEGTAWDVAFNASGWGTTIDPPAVTTTWSGADNTFVAFAWAGSGSPTVTAYPSGYSNTNYETNRVMVATATKTATSDTDNPSAFTISGSNNHRGIVIALRNAAAVSAGAGSAAATATAIDPTQVDPPNVNANATVAAATAAAGFAKTPDIPQASGLVIEWDLDNDGDFDETVEDITDDVLRGYYQVGRDYPSQVTGLSIPGRMNLTVDNSDDRYNFFNTSSPLATAPYSLKTGRLIRIRTTESTPTDPVELARDMFLGNGALATDDLGNTWTTLSGFTGFAENESQAEAIGPPAAAGTDHIAYVDCGQNSYYAQIMVPFKDTTNEIGIAFYVTDANNYGLVYMGDGLLSVVEVVSGTPSTLATSGVENRDDMAIGVAVNGTSVIAYIDGVEEISTTTTLTAQSEVGLYAEWFSQRNPAFTEFRVWDRSLIVQAWDTGVDQSGVVATMRVTKVLPVMRSGRKEAEITAVGSLGALSRPVSSPASTGPDDVQSAGVKAGHMIGNTLARLGRLHPPSVIEGGDLALGSVGFDQQRAISLARRFEQTELGFLFEDTMGGVCFHRRSFRDSLTSVATFTDDPNAFGVSYEDIQQRDWQSDLINQVASEVSPSLPRQIFGNDFNVTNTGVQNDVEITLPTFGTGDTDAAIGDLFVVGFASSVQKDGTFWEEPTGWTSLRPMTDGHGLRVYAKRLAAGDSGDTVTFYDDSTDLAGGGWVAVTVLAKNWYGAVSAGVALTEINGRGGGSAEAQAGDNDPPVAFTPWRIGPTLFVPLRAGITSTGGATVSAASDDQAPPGFDSLGKISVDGVANSHDVGLQWCRRIRTEQVNNPGPFGGQFTGYDIVETAVLMIRGFAGDPPPATGGLRVRSNNVTSQIDRGVLPHPNPGVLYETKAAAETANDLVLSRFDQDRPIISIGFTANTSKRHRDQAVARALSDRVTLTANNNAGLGVAADYYIETIKGSFREGARQWRVTYDLSPVTDPGGGAD